MCMSKLKYEMKMTISLIEKWAKNICRWKDEKQKEEEEKKKKTARDPYT